MKRLLLATGLFAVIAAAQSFAQTPPYTQKAFAQIPFDFQTGDVTMPAGRYLISQTGNVLVVRATKGKPTAMLLTQPTARRRESAVGAVAFTRYGNDYFMATLWSAESREGVRVPQGKREKELIHRMTFVKADEVAVYTRSVTAHESN